MVQDQERVRSASSLLYHCLAPKLKHLVPQYYVSDTDFDTIAPVQHLLRSPTDKRPPSSSGKVTLLERPLVILWSLIGPQIKILCYIDRKNVDMDASI